ncbi:MAG: ABC transporter ATP-binding protein, partial [Pseudonocardiales bacterium]
MTAPPPTSPSPEKAAPKRMPGPGPAGMGRGPAAFLGGMSAEKALDFRGSSRRLLRMLRPQRPLVAAILLLGTTSVTLSVLAPRLLGRATDFIFAGFLGTRAPTESSSAVVRNANTTPGRGIDFGRVGHVL